MQTGVKTSYRKAIIMVLLYLSFVFKNLFLNSANSRAVPYVMSGLGYFSSGSYMVISHIIMAAYSVVACFIGIFLINIVLERTGRMFMPSGQMFYGLAFYTAIANVFIGLSLNNPLYVITVSEFVEKRISESEFRHFGPSSGSTFPITWQQGLSPLWSYRTEFTRLRLRSSWASSVCRRRAV